MSRGDRSILTTRGAADRLKSVLPAGTGQFLANNLVPRWGYKRYADIAYGRATRHALDIYVPNQPAPGAPTIVFFYGGSWQTGSRKSYRFIGQALASRGITVVLPDYRLYPEVGFPLFVEDSATVVAWTKQYIGGYVENAGSLFVAGHSAGAHIAAMLATDGRYLNKARVSVDDLAGFIGLAGPYDFLPIKDPVMRRIFAPESDWPNTQPINFVTGDEPPMLLLHGDADRAVATGNSIRLAEAVEANGGVAEVKIYPGVSHMMLLAPLAAMLRFTGDQLDRIVRFVSRHGVDRPDAHR